MGFRRFKFLTFLSSALFSFTLSSTAQAVQYTCPATAQNVHIHSLDTINVNGKKVWNGVDHFVRAEINPCPYTRAGVLTDVNTPGVITLQCYYCEQPDPDLNMTGNRSIVYSRQVTASSCTGDNAPVNIFTCQP